MKVTITRPEMNPSSATNSAANDTTDTIQSQNDLFLEMMNSLFVQTQADVLADISEDTNQNNDADSQLEQPGMTSDMMDALNLFLINNAALDNQNKVNDSNQQQDTDKIKEDSISSVISSNDRDQKKTIKNDSLLVDQSKKISIEESDDISDQTTPNSDNGKEQDADAKDIGLSFRSENTIKKNQIDESKHVALIATNTNLNVQDIDSLGRQNQDENNKYTDALKQLGNMINQHTSQLLDNNQISRMNLQKPSATYSETMQKILNPVIEPKIEISSSTLSGIARELHQADIRVHPPELGRVLAKLKVHENTAELVIVTQSSRVKEIVEANLQQLKDNFQQSSISLSSINVEVQTADSNARDQYSKKQQDNDLGSEMLKNDSNQMNQKEDNRARVIDSIIDTYI